MSVQVFDNLQVTTGLVFPKASGLGIKIENNANPYPSNPTFGWKDLLGPIVPHVGGGTAPTSTLYRGNGTNIRFYAFANTQVIDQVPLHMPHDYALGTDVYLHLHWTHAGTAISGSLVVNMYTTYCKGYNQSGQTFNAELNTTITQATANVATFPQYGHFIQEFQQSTPGGSASQLDTNLLEPDGLIMVGGVATTVPTISGSPAGSANSPFFLFVDLHYQSTMLTTKNRNAPFYT